MAQGPEVYVQPGHGVLHIVVLSKHLNELHIRAGTQGTGQTWVSYQVMLRNAYQPVSTQRPPLDPEHQGYPPSLAPNSSREDKLSQYGKSGE